MSHADNRIIVLFVCRGLAALVDRPFCLSNSIIIIKHCNMLNDEREILILVEYVAVNCLPYYFKISKHLNVALTGFCGCSFVSDESHDNKVDTRDEERDYTYDEV